MEHAVAAPTGRIRKIGEFAKKELATALPAIAFFAAGFNVVVFSVDLILSNHFLRFGSLMVTTVAALVAGMAVLIAEKMQFFRRFESAPLILPVLIKTCVYTLLVFIARLVEAYIHYMINKGRLIGFSSYMHEQFWSVGTPSTPHLPGWRSFMFVQLWISVLFVIYTTTAELNRFLGCGIFTRLFFTRRAGSSKLQTKPS